MHRVRILALLLALVLAGCGAGTDSTTEFEGPQRDVARAIEDLEEAAQEDDPARICRDLLASDVTERLGADCEKRIQEALDRTDSFALTVESVDVRGTTATARVETGLDEEQVETLTLERQGNRWKIAQLPAGG